MKTKLFLIASLLMLSVHFLNAQPPKPQHGTGKPDDEITSGFDLNSMETSFIININPMNGEKKEKLNRVALNYRSHSRGILADFANPMLAGGVGAVVNVIGTEIINLTQVRSKQKKAWLEMRQKECTFIDSLQSVKGQSDFYGRQSSFGPLDPSDMNFDGITLRANRGGQEVLKMVCHIDTTKLDHLFLHSKFYLVVDTIVFHPYRSFLPNIKVNHVEKPILKKDYEIAKLDTTRKVDRGMYWATQEQLDYYNTISRFSFDEHGAPTVNIKMDIYSSWINELVQVYQDVKLGTFSVNIPVSKEQLQDSLYFYSREEALAAHHPTINMDGDCFVIPRSYMPVAANNPSWGTGEYKMKVVLSEKCRYNPTAGRSKHWHRDYKQLVRMQNHGKAKNDYLGDVGTTFRDNRTTILKATYTPALNMVVNMMGIGTSSGLTGGLSGGKPGAAGKGQGGMPSTTGTQTDGGMQQTGGGNQQGK